MLLFMMYLLPLGVNIPFHLIGQNVMRLVQLKFSLIKCRLFSTLLQSTRDIIYETT